MPVEALVDHPEAMTLPAAAFGMLARLALHFHASQCRPLPTADHELMHIARAHAPTWRHWKARVLAILDDVKPGIEAYQRQCEGRRQGLINAAHSSNATARLNALSKATRSAPPSLAAPFQPKRDPPKAPRPAPPDQRPQRLMVDR